MEKENKDKNCKELFTREEVLKILELGHAQGWNNARGNKITWSDTSLEKTIKLFNELY